MSRRDKQADLRRRMAEARSKLISAQSNPNDHESDQGPAAAGKKRPLPSASSAGGAAGGILRKSKYSSTKTAAPSTPRKESADDGRPPENALGSLMAGYDDSSSDDEGTKSAPPSSSAVNGHRNAPSPSDLVQQTMGGGESIANKKQNKSRKKKKKKGGAIDVTTNAAEREDSLKTEARNFPQETQEHQSEPPLETGEENGKAAEISDEVWDEFNSLLDDDEAKAASSAASNHGPKNPEASVAPPGADAPSKSATKKKSKKKKKKGAAKDMYDNEAINNVEQASYEARLARLVLLKSKKTHDRNNEADSALPSTDEFYDTGLAFRQEGGDAQEGEEESIEDDAKPSPDAGGGESPTSTGAPSNAPRISLAQILRDRRDQARKLSSRGDDGNAVGSDPADNKNADGRWF